ncbi:MAG: hypothetical protein WBC51_00695 [Vicinamibacterales bacterium]
MILAFQTRSPAPDDALETVIVSLGHLGGPYEYSDRSRGSRLDLHRLRLRFLFTDVTYASTATLSTRSDSAAITVSTQAQPAAVEVSLVSVVPGTSSGDGASANASDYDSRARDLVKRRDRTL